LNINIRHKKRTILCEHFSSLFNYTVIRNINQNLSFFAVAKEVPVLRKISLSASKETSFSGLTTTFRMIIKYFLVGKSHTFLSCYMSVYITQKCFILKLYILMFPEEGFREKVRY
jgi:hypothetical protein